MWVPQTKDNQALNLKGRAIVQDQKIIDPHQQPHKAHVAQQLKAEGGNEIEGKYFWHDASPT